MAMDVSKFEITFVGMDHTWIIGRDITTDTLEKVLLGMSFVDSLVLQQLCQRIANTCSRLRVGE